MPTPLHSIKFWIKAFIPRDIPNLTKIVPKGPYAGQTMINGPTPFSDCFLTDQRSFSNRVDAKSRLHSEFKIAISGQRLTFTQWHNCDFTTECDCEDGALECSKKGDTSRMRFKFPTNPQPWRQMHIDLIGAANNPCYSGSPDVDYEGTIAIDLAARSIEFDGKVDAFPAFEAYATINDGAGVALFQRLPREGKTPFNLVGGPSESVKGKLRDQWMTGILQKSP